VCVLELASMLAGERFSDRPASVCPVIGAILRAYNDSIRDESRHDLLRFAADAVGTRGGYELAHRRASVALAWARARYEVRAARWFGLRKPPREPDAGWGPDLVAEHVIRSLGRRITVDAHAAVLALIDELIALGSERQLVEHLPEAVEDRGGLEKIRVAEVFKGGAPERLELQPAALDHLAPALGQRGQHDALVAV
jgi:hypothetical protein